MEKEKIEAVVVTYNRKDLLVECLKSLLEQTRTPDEIFVIDNNSADGTFDLLNSNKMIEKIDYVQLDKNIGGSGGFFEGMKAAYLNNFDWVWVMDDDTIPNKDALEKLASSLFFVKDEKVSFVASSVFGTNGEFMNVPELDTTFSDNGYEKWYKYLKDGLVQIKTATFVSLLINAKAIKKCGLSMKDYFIWDDDSEYTTRLTKYYGPAFFVGDSTVVHKRKNAKRINIIEDDSNRLDFYFYLFRNELINTREYEGVTKMFIKMLVYLKIIFKILFGNSKNKYKKVFIIIKGVFAYLFKRYDYKAFRNRLDINYFIG